MVSKSQQTETSLSELAYKALKHEIMENLLSPGYQEMEPELVIRLGMSRTPVREAVIRLSKEGLVDVIPRRGIRVKPVSVEDMKEIYELLAVLEAEASAKVAMLPTSSLDLDPMIKSVELMERALDQKDLNTWAKADDNFHRSLLELCPNRRLAQFVGQLLDQAHRVRMFTLLLREIPYKSTQEHWDLIKDLQAGDTLSVQRNHRVHREKASRELINILERHQLKRI